MSFSSEVDKNIVERKKLREKMQRILRVERKAGSTEGAKKAGHLRRKKKH